MSPLARLCLIALVVSVSAVLRDGNVEKAIERGDAYIDKMLQEMFENENDDYDPYKMEDSVVGFNKKVIFVNVSGEAKLHDGYITGLRTLHRSDHCSLTEKDGRLIVKADMGAGVLDFHYSGSAKFMNYGPTITVQGTLSYVEVHMEFSVNSKTGENGTLEKFVIDDMRGMKVWVSGLGPINWAVNPIISGVTAIFKRFVRNFLNNKVESHVAERIPNYKFPVEEDDTVTEATDEPETSPDVVTDEPETSPDVVTDEPETSPDVVTDEPETSPDVVTDEPETSPDVVTDEPETSPDVVTDEPETSPDVVTDEPETSPDVVTDEPETSPDVVTDEPETSPDVVTDEPETSPDEATESTEIAEDNIEEKSGYTLVIDMEPEGTPDGSFAEGTPDGSFAEETPDGSFAKE